VASTAAALPLTLISTFFNVAFLATVDAHARGRELGIRDALRFARSRFRAILAWSLLATLVGSALRALENVNGADLVARLFSALAGLAWSLATYFVIPILAMEQLSVRESMKRSAQVFRRQWGPQVTGDLVISAFFGILVMPGLFTAFAGYTTLSNGNTAAGVIVVAIAVLLVAPVLVMSNAITQVFSLAVYRHAMGAPLPTPFTEEDVRAAFKPKKPPFWRRWRRKGAEKE
jgi:hypothetical protein